MRRNTHTFFSLALALALPVVLHAQDTFASLVDRVINIMTLLIPLILVIGVLIFIWNATKLTFGAGENEVRTKGKRALFWGVVVLFMFVSIWGIIQLVVRTFFS